MADPKGPNQSSEMEPAEGSRNTVNVNVDDREADERYQDADADTSGAGGITNRPLEEERRNQHDLPGRGNAKPGGHAS